MTAHVWSETQVPNSSTEHSVGSNVSERCLLEMNKILKPVPLPRAIRLGSVYAGLSVRWRENIPPYWSGSFSKKSLYFIASM